MPCQQQSVSICLANAVKVLSRFGELILHYPLYSSKMSFYFSLEFVIHLLFQFSPSFQKGTGTEQKQEAGLLSVAFHAAFFYTSPRHICPVPTALHIREDWYDFSLPISHSGKKFFSYQEHGAEKMQTEALKSFQQSRERSCLSYPPVTQTDGRL